MNGFIGNLGLGMILLGLFLTILALYFSSRRQENVWDGSEELSFIGYRVCRTSYEFPEAYDVLHGQNLVGTLRLRNGFFRAVTATGITVYEYMTSGIGRFDDGERERLVKKALIALKREVEKYPV